MLKRKNDGTKRIRYRIAQHGVHDRYYAITYNWIGYETWHVSPKRFHSLAAARRYAKRYLRALIRDDEDAGTSPKVVKEGEV